MEEDGWRDGGEMKSLTPPVWWLSAGAPLPELQVQDWVTQRNDRRQQRWTTCRKMNGNCMIQCISIVCLSSNKQTKTCKHVLHSFMGIKCHSSHHLALKSAEMQFGPTTKQKPGTKFVLRTLMRCSSFQPDASPNRTAEEKPLTLIYLIRKSFKSPIL